jgi:uncharacterized small protein (DUF1192 family)
MAEEKKDNIQELQQEFNMELFRLGDCRYRIKMLNAEIAKLNDESNTHIQNLDNLGKKAQSAKAGAEAELMSKVAEGTPDESK